jgi:hypothetical protein
MKIWKSYGSGHSAHLTVIGKFEKAEDAKIARDVVEDFVNGAWEERYPDNAAFITAWKERIPAIPYLGPNDREFEMGVDDAPDVELAGTTLMVSSIRSHEIGGIIKLMLLKDATEVKVTGRTGP